MRQNTDWDRVNEAIKNATPKGNANERYQDTIKNIDNNPNITPDEKKAAKRFVLREKDRENLLFLKGPTYPCNQCNRNGYTMNDCEHCMRDCLKKENTWTSENQAIDEAIKESQNRLPIPAQIMEWIPYSDLKDIKRRTTGGCAEIFDATWTKGYIKSFDKESQTFQRSEPLKVILKKYTDDTFFKEILRHIELRSRAYKLVGCRGVSRDSFTKNYFLVLDEMKHDLRSFVTDPETKLTWKEIYRLLLDIATALSQIHEEGLIHKDLHSGNVLQRKDSVWVIADLGFCGPPTKPDVEGYGCPPYVAPELFRETGSHSFASDVYSFGMLMYVAATGHPPFDKESLSLPILALNICNGARPEVPSYIPNHFGDTMRSCWRAKPSDRPTAKMLCEYFSKQWKSCLNANDNIVQRLKVPTMTTKQFAIRSGTYKFQDLPKPTDEGDNTEEDVSRIISLEEDISRVISIESIEEGVALTFSKNLQIIKV